MAVTTFPKEALDEAHAMYITYELFKDRPHVKGITIDGPDSKDLDDGIFLKQKDGKFLLSVSIADVASLVTLNTALYAETLKRVSTRYYSNGNSPMLPRILSEFKLSLIPHRIRPAITFDMVITPDGEVENFQIRETMFKSFRRLSYGEFDDIISSEDQDINRKLFSDMTNLANFLLEKRRQKGSLAIYDLKKGIYTTEEGLIAPLDENSSHQANIVIQEFMILTNTTVAKFFAEKDIPFLFRNHTVSQNAPSRNEILEQMNIALLNPKYIDTLRSRSSIWFNRANYGPELIGHYGLNETVYSHVTSPIRRVPDLINHHIIKEYIKDGKPKFQFNDLKQLAAHINLEIKKIKEMRSNIFKEQSKLESRISLNYSSDLELSSMKPEPFKKILKEAIRFNLLFENLEKALHARFDTKRVDATLIYMLLFKTNKEPIWQDFFNKAMIYIKKKQGFPVQILNLLLQKVKIEFYDFVIETSENNFRACINAVIAGQKITLTSQKFSENKTTAKHVAAYELLCKLLDYADEVSDKQPTPSNAETSTNGNNDEISSESIFEFAENDLDSENEDYVEQTELEDNIMLIESGQTEKTDGWSEISNESEKIDLDYENVKYKLASKAIFSNAPPKEIVLLESIEENYIGKLLELCTKHIDWQQPTFEFTVTGSSHSPIINCYAKLITPKMTISEHIRSKTKKMAKHAAASKILEIIAENELDTAEIDVSAIKEPEQTDNWVGLVQDYCQQNMIPLPVYNFTQSGELNHAIFACRLEIVIDGEIKVFRGNNTTKKAAKHAAAAECCKFINHINLNKLKYKFEK